MVIYLFATFAPLTLKMIFFMFVGNIFTVLFTKNTRHYER